MVISQQDAVAALRDVELTQARTRDASAYLIGSRHLFLWGAIWIVGYTLMGLLAPRTWGLVWLVLDVAGVGGALLLKRGTGQGGDFAKWFGAFVAIFLFIVATYVVMGPFHAAQYQMYPILVVALIYALVGTWRLPRYVWIGAAIFVLAMIGFVFLKPWLPFWLAFVGGGGLIVGGLWLRRA